MPITNINYKVVVLFALLSASCAKSHTRLGAEKDGGDLDIEEKDGRILDIEDGDVGSDNQLSDDGDPSGDAHETTQDFLSSNEPWWIVTDEHGCESVRAPTKADRPDEEYEGDDIAPIYLAISRVNLGANNDDEEGTPNPDAWKEFGFDRDGRCTGSPTCCVDPTECEENGIRADEPSCNTSGGGIAVEGNYCIDNAMGSIFSIAFSMFPLEDSPFNLIGMTAADWNCELRRGGFSMILKISDYNGKENDPFVRLDMYVSTGLQGLERLTYKCREDLQSPLNEEWYDFPLWFPTEHWKIAKRSIAIESPPTNDEVPDSTTYDSTAYVRNGYLFAALPDGSEFTFAGDNTPVPGFRNIMYRPVLLAKFFYDKNDREWKMGDGTLSFYITSSGLLRSFREVGFCENMCGTVEMLKGFADGSLDVLLSGESIPNVPCTALSLATKFEALQATATAADVEEIVEPMECPPLRNPDMPPYGCLCQPDGSCVLPVFGE